MTNINQDQIDFWNSEAAARWVQFQETLDRSLVPMGTAVIDKARLTPGERVLDVGCGCGTTTLQLAHAVGPAGHVVAVDVSEPMLTFARERFAASAERQISSVLADAAVHEVTPPVDVVFSRFGVMFFRDPVAAFTNIRRALRPGGRMVFVCWRAPMENPWMAVPMAAARPLLPPMDPPKPDDPGPFAFADPARLRAILESAGFTDIALDPFNTSMLMSTSGIEAAVNFSIEAGPLARLLREVDEATRERVRAAVRASFAPFVTGETVAPPAATWIVSARR